MLTMTAGGPVIESLNGASAVSETVTVTAESETIATTESSVSNSFSNVVETNTVTTLEPGPFAQESIPARGPDRLNAAEQRAINKIGDTYGCHTCGNRNSGYVDGHWTGDHQPPSELASPESLFPHCKRCMHSQGGIVKGVKEGRIPNPY